MTINVEGKDTFKSEDQYYKAGYKMLGPDEFNRISSCTMSKKTWDKLVNSTNEENTKVKSLKVLDYV